MGANISLACNPPIGRSATLTLPPGSTPESEVDCVFTARFDTPEGRAQARSAGARLELWSDIPWAGEAYGQWHTLSFVWADELPKDTKTHGRVAVTPAALPPGDVPLPVLNHPAFAARASSPAPSASASAGGSPPSSPISTTTTAVDAADADEQPDLVLRFSTRFPTPIWGGPLRFCYTYRLVWPDGGVQWLGEFGSDGQLFVERKVDESSWRRPASVGRRTPSRTPARTPSPRAVD